MSLLKKMFGILSKPEVVKEEISPVFLEQNKEVKVEKKLSKQNFEVTITDGELSPEEILMLGAKEGSSANDDYYPGFWNYQYNINPKEVFVSLVRRGYFEETKSLENTLNSRSVDELKEILRKNELKLSGKKSVLIDRILNEMPKKDLANIELKSVYKLSLKGQELKNKNEHIIYFHRNAEYNISIYQAHDFKMKHTHYSSSDIASHLLKQQSQEFLSKGDWGLYRNARLNLARVALTEDKFETALKFLYEVCYIDLSGLGNNFSLKFIDIYEKYFFPYENSNHTIAPGVIKLLIKTKVKLKLNDNQLLESLLSFLDEYHLPFHLFTKEEVLNIVLAEINNNKSEVSNIYKHAEHRYFSNRKKY
ncbi:SAP domain-containing protein [Lysinibacillus fusiformis]|uniref:SAP domain-containing protein n=1 Tax=Lysinibacillus fusiformis TaxID=28031 RepID=UPI00046963C6|nr:SAP domain-containing protein [Lysinibacillus fusiformis]